MYELLVAKPVSFILLSIVSVIFYYYIKFLKFGPMQTVSTLVLQKKHHDEAFRWISKGLDVDSSNPKEAMVCYHRGLQALKQGLQLTFDNVKDRRDGERLRAKMSKNLVLVEERLATLHKHVESSPKAKLSHTSKVASPPSCSMQGQQGSSGKFPSVPTVAPKENKTIRSSSSGEAIAVRSKRPVTKKPVTKTPVQLEPFAAKPQPKPPSSSRSARSIHPRTVARSVEPRKQSNNTKRLPQQGNPSRKASATSRPSNSKTSQYKSAKEAIEKELKNVDKKLVQVILNEIVDDSSVAWSDVIGLQDAKQALEEAVVLPLLKPEIFTGLLRPPVGLLLFGPPGTGKTLLAKAVSSKAKTTFFAVGASSLTSKFLGESEKLVRTLFAVARVLQPSIIFIDEIDSLLSSRSSSDHDAMIRVKNEFLVQLSSVSSDQCTRILVLGATNRPEQIDEAARRRFEKRIYIPLPDLEARISIIQHLFKDQQTTFTSNQLKKIGSLTKGYSGSDLAGLCREAAMCPIRESMQILLHSKETKTRKVTYEDVVESLKKIRPSVDAATVKRMLAWNEALGSKG